MSCDKNRSVHGEKNSNSAVLATCLILAVDLQSRTVPVDTPVPVPTLRAHAPWLCPRPVPRLGGDSPCPSRALKENTKPFGTS